MDDFIERIKRVRLSNKLTQQKFAEALGSSQGNVADWERGRSVPSAAAIRKIVNTFSVDPAWLMNGSSSSSETLLSMPYPLNDDEKKEITQFAHWLVAKRPAPHGSDAPSSISAETTGAGTPSHEESTVTMMLPVISNPKSNEPVPFEQLLKGFAPINKSLLQGACMLLLIDEDQLLHTGMRRNDLALIQLHARPQPGDLAALRLHHQIVFAYCQQSKHSLEYKLLHAPESPPISSQDSSLVGKVLHIIKQEHVSLTFHLAHAF
ncbi:helix-turn-helix domain-containing protein [Anoxynatronum buryatiense]|uniref:helix-turn-helix domain-containing protein n=1 Tax=Anoxynatronum buryatiense TaxID=489973 RepID=UPI0024B756CB|nr:helix-turn-helix transcriptional regulator [Anoxynatronum buryatiense]